MADSEKKNPKPNSPKKPGKSRDSSKSGDYEVGYGKPPKEHQFKSGQSGYPGGRKKGSRNMRTIIKRSINQSMPIKIDGRKVKVPAKEAVFLGLQIDALKRNGPARRQYFEMIAQYAPEELEAAVEEMRLSSENREILERYEQRILDKKGVDDEPDENQ